MAARWPWPRPRAVVFARQAGNPLLRPATQPWEVHRDIIFPSVVPYPRELGDGLGAYYLYYSMHDAPGGIGLATADRLEGPWVKYPGNPVLTVNPSGTRNAHVSSPEVVWVAERQCFHLYYHGCGEWPGQTAAQTTGLAIGRDGIRWEKQPVPVLASVDTGAWNGNELSYARVSRVGGRFVMTYMARDRRRSAPVLGLATSADGLTWAMAATPFLAAGPETQVFISSGQLVEIDGRLLLFYTDETARAENARVLATMSEDGGRTWRSPVAILTPSVRWRWDRTRTHDPFVVVEAGVAYLFYAGGPRRRAAGIGLATGSVAGLLDRLRGAPLAPDLASFS